VSMTSLGHPHSAAHLDPLPSVAWKHELRARLREHQQRRGGASLPVHAPGSHTESRSSSRVAERVAKRYRDVPSYGELLAASADAAAAAAVAAQHAVDAAHLAHVALSRWQVDGQVDRQVELVERDAVQGSAPQGNRDWQSAAYSSLAPSGQAVAESRNLLLSPGTSSLEPARQVRTHAPLPVRSVPPARNTVAGRTYIPTGLVDAFAEAVVPAARALPAKLIEFPRELIAPRRQRPRLAEGPLVHPQDSQSQPDLQDGGTTLRIFEVAGEVAGIEAGTHLQKGPGAAVIMEVVMETGEPEWERMAPGEYRMQTQSEKGQAKEQGSFEAGGTTAPSTQSGWAAIHLGEHPGGRPSQHLDEQQPAMGQLIAARLPEHGYAAESLPALHDLAPVSDRFMAALVDSVIVCSCFLLAVLVFASCTVHPPVGRGAMAVAALVFCALAALYGWLFMSYGGGSTPGMRYARIALCTFNDENPRRRDLQNRVPATALSLLPLGLGAFWALFDENKLSWHDRMTRTYQRSYR